MKSKNKLKNQIDKLIFLMVLMFSLTIMTSSALDNCILPCTGDYAYPFCKILAFLNLIFFSATISTFVLIFLLIIGGMNEKSKNKEE
jgi:hypothetical protein